MASVPLKVSVHMMGLEQLRRALRALPEKIQARELGAAVAAGASVIRQEAKALVPVLKEPQANRLPGVLRRAIRSTRGKRRDSEASAVVSIRLLSKKAVAAFKAKGGKSSAQNPNDPFYWRFVEFGTSKMRAQPFLRSAFNTKKEQAAQRIKERLAQVIARQVETLNRYRAK